MREQYHAVVRSETKHDDELMHYGILGMKWGVRRYQRKDGTLTRAGKKRVDEGANLYPTYKGKRLRYMSERSRNRDTVVDKISREKSKEDIAKYERYKKRNPNFAKDANSDSDRMSMWNTRIRDKSEKEATRQKYAQKFIEEYGNATLKDLNIEINASTKKYVSNLIKDRNLSDSIVGSKDTTKSSKFTSEKKINDTFQKKLDSLNKREQQLLKKENEAYDSYHKTGDAKQRERGEKILAKRLGIDLEYDDLMNEWSSELDRFYGKV